MKVAFYKGPPSNIIHRVSHEATCWYTNSLFSHCELVIYGVCYSASARDGGVRSKVIDLDSGHWELVDTFASEEYALKAFEATRGLKYDWAGVGRYVFPSLPNLSTRWYCSEWCAYALGHADTDLHPGALYHRLQHNRSIVIGPEPMV